jgi:hypothetical protein
MSGKNALTFPLWKRNTMFFAPACAACHSKPRSSTLALDDSPRAAVHAVQSSRSIASCIAGESGGVSPCASRNCGWVALATELEGEEWWYGIRLPGRLSGLVAGTDRGRSGMESDSLSIGSVCLLAGWAKRICMGHLEWLDDGAGYNLVPSSFPAPVLRWRPAAWHWAARCRPARCARHRTPVSRALVDEGQVRRVE